MRFRSLKAGLVVTMLALGMSAAASASASASEFVFNKTGALEGHLLQTQKFHTAVGVWECTSESVTGSVASLKSDALKTTVQYSGCKGVLGHTLTVSPAEYEFHAGTTRGAGTVSILKPITVTGKVEGEVACTMTFPAQTVHALGYKNLASGELELVPAVTGIESEGKGELCTYAKEKAGTLEGASAVGLTGGTLEWVE